MVERYSVVGLNGNESLKFALVWFSQLWSPASRNMEEYRKFN